MKKFFLIMVLSIGLISGLMAQNNCTYCDEPAFGDSSSNIGSNNSNFGILSLAAGEKNVIGTQFNEIQTAIAIGLSNSIGTNISLGGSYSIAIGNENELFADSSYAFGHGNMVSSKYGLAFGNTNTVSGDNAIAIGNHANASGEKAISIGELSKSTAQYSLAVGRNCEATDMLAVSYGFNCKATNIRAVAIGTSCVADHMNSIAFGRYAKASAKDAMTIGIGLGIDYPITNTEENSLVIGFNSTLPTFFVGKSAATDKTGRIGIGNITTPEAKLHIKADNDEDASLLLQPTGSTYFGKLMLGDENHSISSRTGENLEFKTQTDKDFVFKNGSIFIEDQFSGLILKSPDGQCWKGMADNNGSFVLESINCNLMTNEKKNPEVPQQTARIFPNPASHKLSIELSSGISQAYARFYNDQGILLLQKELRAGNNSVSLRKMPLGVLVVRVSDEKGNLLSVEKVMHQ